MVSKIKNNVDKFISLTSLLNDELKSRLASNERFEELSNIASLGNPSRKETRLIFLSIGTMIDIIEENNQANNFKKSF
ncbi:unnamed protein product [Brachionus calyciflorus]|uniref:Uncharacterized protein n=1 Tax=Brachionus calyciflorus TaxID=104777 RepID=A0A813W0T6_9BILA|nr:unnamed protein product [Brachionus calyciflorus]